MKDNNDGIKELHLPECFSLVGEYNKIFSHCVSKIPPVILGDIQIVPIVFHSIREIKTGQTKFHQHKFYELSFMLFGCMDYDLQGKKCHLSCENNGVVLIPDGMIHDRITSVAPALVSGFMLDIVALNNDGKKLLPKIRNVMKKADFHFAIPTPILDFRECLLEELKTHRPFFNNKITLLLHNFLLEMFREYFGHLLWNIRRSSGTGIAYEPSSFIYMIKTFVEENLCLPLSVIEVAEPFHLCARHLNRIFTDQTGISLGKYIINRKIEAAKKMLLRPSVIVKDAAYSLGFKNTSYFCRIFKKKVGVTPMEYKNKAISANIKQS